MGPTSRYIPLLLIALAACTIEDPQVSSSPDDNVATNVAASEPRFDPQSAARQNEARPPRTPAEQALQARLSELGSAFDGDVGIAVRDIGNGWTAQYNGAEQYPQQSVSKIWVAIALLDLVDQGALDLSEKVIVRRDDLTVFYQPIRGLVLRDGEYETTLGDLLVRAIAWSDNTANDILMRRAGGAEAVRRILADKGLSGIRFGPGERLLQSRIAGLEWRPEYSIGRAFFDARENVPSERRRAAFEAYLNDPMDGASAAAMADSLAKLKRGKLLSPRSTEQLLSIMEETRSGPRRLKGGLATGWSISHKTGTGQILDGAQAGYNDVGLLTAPSGRAYSIAVLIGRTSRPVPERMRLMQNAVRAVTEYDESFASTPDQDPRSGQT